MLINEKDLRFAMESRHSVRAYINKPIEITKVEELTGLINRYNEEGNLHLQFIKDAGGTCVKLFNTASGIGTAPSVIACVGPDDDTLEERCGYYGEKIVLCAQLLGLNTCWVGMINRKACPVKINDGERFVLVIAIGYGANTGKPHKSKSREDVIVGEGEKPLWFYQGVDAALLAPTAVNQQKFMIKYEGDDKVTIIDKCGPCSKVDIGIVKYHFEVGAEKKTTIF